jgi:hydroxyacylglutathione hydrolase
MFDIIPIPAFKDNYIWALRDGQHAIIVDPGDAAPVRAYLEQHKLRLGAILCTHHHGDHTGGICELVQVYNAPVYGPQHEDIPCMDHAMGEGDKVSIASPEVEFTVWDIPGHTRGHIAYLFHDAGVSSVFCGDTLFGCGCGRLFEGTPAQLYHSLQRLAALPADTRVYCTHEYTEANIRFALTCEPGNPQLQQRKLDAHALRAQGQPTLPSNIALENATNPFLRCNKPEIIQNVGRHYGSQLAPADELTTFTALRAWKNMF